MAGAAGTGQPTRFVVHGAGAIGGVVGGRLTQHGYEVVLIARGPHFEALQRHGLRLESPDGAAVLEIPVVDHPSAVAWRPGDVVLLTTKSHDTRDALDALVSTGVPSRTPVICVQNGVCNERMASRFFPLVYGTCVMLPASHLEPGVVQASSGPVTGILDVGRFPAGTDDTATEIAAALAASTFSAEAKPDIMRWKYCKLLLNLANAPEALFGHDERAAEITRLARREGVACLRAAGIEFASKEEDALRRGDLVRVLPVEGRVRGGGSSWQSLARGAGSIETAYLNGEIVLIGRLCDQATPVNELLTRLALEAAHGRRPPGSASPEDFLAELARDPSDPADAPNPH